MVKRGCETAADVTSASVRTLVNGRLGSSRRTSERTGDANVDGATEVRL